MAESDDKMSSVSSDRIPNLVQIGAIPTEYGQTLTSDVIDASTFNQNRVRFTLSRVAGFLHSKSKVTLSVTPLTNTGSYYPVNIGISQLIRSAELLVGNKTICHVDDYSSFHAYQSLFITNENNREREQFLSQRVINHQPVYDNRATADADETPNGADKVGLANGLNPVVDVGNGNQTFKLLPFQLHDGSSAQGIADAPVYSVYLSDLFPFLETNQIPAFMIDEEIHIDLTFQDQTTVLGGSLQSRRMLVPNGATVDVAYQVNQNEVKLLYDSISYDGEIMRKYREQNKKLVFQYVDYRLAKRTGDQTAFSDLTFQIGGNGRLVSKVIFGLQNHNHYRAEALIGGDAGAVAPPADNELTVNMRYNDRFEFAVDRSNKALLFTTTQQSEGKVPFVTRDEYQNQNVDGTTPATLEGNEQSSKIHGTRGNFSWTALRLNKGERVNNKGIEITYKNPGLPAHNYTLRCYLELLKVATIEDGKMSCYFA